MQVPETLPLLMGQGNDETIKAILSNPEDHQENLMRLSRICKVKLTFNTPITVWQSRRKFKNDVTEHIFGGFFKCGVGFCYKFSTTSRHGQYLNMDLVKSYEPVFNPAFKTFEQFKKKFDLFFITEAQIKKLWEETSSQTGQRYTPADFRQIGPAGKKALESFLRQFRGVSNVDPSTYSPRTYAGQSYHMADGYCDGTGMGNFSRDISISHRLGNPLVHYASEYSGTGNGRYGLLVTKNTFLWMEDD